MRCSRLRKPLRVAMQPRASRVDDDVPPKVLGPGHGRMVILAGIRVKGWTNECWTLGLSWTTDQGVWLRGRSAGRRRDPGRRCARFTRSTCPGVEATET